MTKAKELNDKSLQPMERLLLWRLAISGGDWLTKLQPPKIETKYRKALKVAGLIIEEKRTPEHGRGKATFLELTDAGWCWLNDHATEPMAFSPNAKTVHTLESLIFKLGRYLEATQGNLADFLYPNPGATRRTDPPSEPTDDLTGRIVAAAETITGGRLAVRVRLADLRAALSDVPREDLDRAILRLATDGVVSLFPLDNPLEIEPRDQEAALRTPAGDIRHILYMGNKHA
jgi:hypothetical protein